MKPLAFLREHGVVLAAARGPVPSLAHWLAPDLRGSWWGHARGKQIFDALGELSDAPDVLMCKLIEGKRTFVHARLWPALLRVQPGACEGLDQVTEEHTASGKHVKRAVAWPGWVPAAVRAAARRLGDEEARAALGEAVLAALGGAKAARAARGAAEAPAARSAPGATAAARGAAPPGEAAGRDRPARSSRPAGSAASRRRRGSK